MALYEFYEQRAKEKAARDRIGTSADTSLSPQRREELARQEAIKKYGPDIVEYSKGGSSFSGRDGTLDNYHTGVYAPRYTGPSIAERGLSSNFVDVFNPASGWYAYDATPGKSGGYIGNSGFGGILTAPIRSVGSIATNIAHGENVGETLKEDLAISQGAITGAIDSWGGRAGDEIADYGQRLTDITGNNVQGIGDAAESISQGDVRAGNREAEESSRNAWRNPEVAIPASILAAYFGQTWLAPYLSGGAAAAGAGAGTAAVAGGAAAGATVGAGTAAAMGDSNLTDAAVSGGVSGAANAGLGQLFGPTTGYVDAGLRGAGTSAVTSAARGNDRDQILYDAGVGGLSSMAGYGTGDYFQSQQAGRFAGAGTNLALNNLFESPNERASEQGWNDYYSNLMSQLSSYQGQYNMGYTDTSGGFNPDTLQNTPEGQELLSLFDVDSSDPTKKTSKLGGSGQFSQGGIYGQQDIQDPSLTGEYMA